MSITRAELFTRAKEAGQEHNFDGMVDCIYNMIKQDPRLTPEERDIFYISYKNAVGRRREELRRAPDAAKEREIAHLCNEVLELVENFLLPEARSAEDQAFYTKIKGDYHRYIAEVSRSDAQIQRAAGAYLMATSYAATLRPSHPIRLNIVLNYGVLLYEICGERQRGFSITKQALVDGERALEGLTDEDRREAAFVLSLLHDNIELWEKELHA
eukprot:NODE_3795_length_914_cov_71.616185_g3490_i0.p1 GENE.NODE_3795_length_914_cov_71.616185_g3490_i0~~NODE_3795_length_914_cov_71.616185_g3490_i0.p1  ORF type:complete len:243 (+),score=70.32 NODE_3795_length_914_cov_71.616185_g3490_i0:90-731(+)